MSQLLQNKLSSYRTQLRKTQIASLMTKIRYETLHQHTRADLSKLIDTPLDQYSPDHLALLL